MKKLYVLGIMALLLISIASAETIYNSIPSPLAGSYPSLGYQATSTSALGDHIDFDGVSRDLTTVTVTLTNWACENDFTYTDGHWISNRASSDACVTTPGSTFSHPITLNIYAVDNSGANPAVGALIATKTETFNIPFRPSWNEQDCPNDGPIPNSPFGGKWYDPVSGTCVSGYNNNIEFDFSSDSVVLPDEVIYSVAYNTQSYGANPIGENGPYNSLNYGLPPNAPTVGTNIESDTLFWDTTYPGYTAGLKRDTDWAGYVPAAKFDAGQNGNEVPEFGVLGATLVLIGTIAFMTFRKRK